MTRTMNDVVTCSMMEKMELADGEFFYYDFDSNVWRLTDKPVRPKLVTIKPEQAKALLDSHNNSNRRLARARAVKFAREIQRGTFRLTNNAIGFKKNGDISDGQHRLMGCVIANTPIQAYIIFGLDQTAQDVIDDGKSRNDFDAICINQMGISARAAKFGSYLLRETVVNGKKKGRQERLSDFEEIRDALEFAASLLPRTGKARFLSNVVGAVIARAYIYHQHDPFQIKRIERFAECLVTGDMDPEKDKQVKLFREWCVANPREHRGQDRIELYHKAERALQAYLSGEDIQLLRVVKKELFPLPDEM